MRGEGASLRPAELFATAREWTSAGAREELRRSTHLQTRAACAARVEGGGPADRSVLDEARRIDVGRRAGGLLGLPPHPPEPARRQRAREGWPGTARATFLPRAA